MNYFITFSTEFKNFHFSIWQAARFRFKFSLPFLSFRIFVRFVHTFHLKNVHKNSTRMHSVSMVKCMEANELATKFFNKF